MQAQGRHAHGGDPVGGVGHQVGVPPYGGWGRHQGHCVGEAGGRVGQGEPGVGEGQPGEGFRLERNLIVRKRGMQHLARGVENVGAVWWPVAERKLWRGSALGEQPVSGPHILFRQGGAVEPKLPLTLQLSIPTPTSDQGTTSGQMRYNLPCGCCTAVPGVGKQMAGQAATSEPYQMRGAGGGGPGGAGWPGAPGQGRRPRGQGEARAVAAVERAVRIGGGGGGRGGGGGPGGGA